MTVELTDAEAAFLAKLVSGAPVTGNLDQLRQHVRDCDALLAKLDPPPKKEE